MVNDDDNKESNDPGCDITRRELLKKYGTYTAPTVVSLALPSTVNAHTGDFSSLDACIASGTSMGFPAFLVSPPLHGRDAWSLISYLGINVFEYCLMIKTVIGKQNAQTSKKYSRRELLKKYGAYTAPVVVALAVPSGANAHNAPLVTYSTLAECILGDNHLTMNNMNMHCFMVPQYTYDLTHEKHLVNVKSQILVRKYLIGLLGALKEYQGE